MIVAVGKGTDEVFVLKKTVPCALADLQRKAAPVLESAGVRRAIVFGSWARGEADGFSDFDLAVVMDTDLPRPERGRLLATELADVLPTVVDLIVYTPAEFAAGQASGFDVFHALERAGVDIL